MIIQEENLVVFHSEHDQEWTNSEGKYHRIGAPAVIEADGTQKWYHKGKIHREGGPAVNKPDGTQKWYVNGNPTIWFCCFP